MIGPFLTRTHSWEGSWWLPDAPTEKKTGTLTYDPDGGLSLTLAAGFRSVDEVEATGGHELIPIETFPLVHGESKGEPITLIDATVTSSSASRLGYDRNQRLGPSTAFVGAHVDTAAPDCVEVKDIPAGLAWWVDGLTNAITGPFGDSTVTVTPGEQPSLRYRPTHAVSLDGATDELWHFAAIVALATDAPRTSLAREFTLGDGTRIREFRRQLPAPVCYAPESAADWPLFRPDDVDPVTAWQTWRAVDERHRVAINILTRLPHLHSVFVEPEVLITATLVEVFTRVLDPSRQFPDDEYQTTKRDAIAISLPQHTEWLKNVFPRNDPGLGKRLATLVERAATIGGAHLLHNPKRWIKVFKVRNDFAHRGSLPFDVAEVLAVVRVAQCLVLLVLADEIGIATDVLLRGFQDFRRLRSALHMSARYVESAPIDAAAIERLPKHAGDFRLGHDDPLP